MLLNKKRFLFSRLRSFSLPANGGAPAENPAPTPAPSPAPSAENGGDGTPPSTDPVPSENGFPAHTPLAEMTLEEERNYWRFHSRKHEKEAERRKTEAQEQADQLEAQRVAALPPSEQLLEQARAEGRAQAQETFGAVAVRAQFQALLPSMTSEQLDELFEDVSITNFFKDGSIDTERIKRLAAKFAPAEDPASEPGQQQQLQGGSVLGFVLNHTTPPSGNGNSLDEIRQRVASQFKPKTSA